MAGRTDGSVCNANTNGVAGLCLDVHDLAISKYVAGRDKGREFTRVLAVNGMTRLSVLQDRLAATPLADAARTVVRQRIAADF